MGKNLLNRPSFLSFSFYWSLWQDALPLSLPLTFLFLSLSLWLSYFSIFVSGTKHQLKMSFVRFQLWKKKQADHFAPKPNVCWIYSRSDGKVHLFTIGRNKNFLPLWWTHRVKVHWFFNKVAKQFDCHPRWSGDIYEFENSVGTKDRAYKAEDVGRP